MAGKMKFIFDNRPPIVFSDGTVFLAVASIALDLTSLEWQAPQALAIHFDQIAKEISSQNCMSSKRAVENGLLLEQLIGAEEGTLRWNLAVNYEYSNQEPPIQSDISTLYNQVDTLPNGIINDEYSKTFQQYKWATCHIEKNEIVSVCHSYNRAISIETKPEYRRKGFGKACLLRITKELIADGLHPGYGTGYDNVASRKAAESAGFELTRYRYWIEIPADRRSMLPEEITEIIEQANGRKK